MKKLLSRPCADCQDASRHPHPQRSLSGAMQPVEAAGRALRLAAVSLDGVEVTQAIQNMNHDVPLVARKRTVVRVYLSAATPTPMLVCGVLKVRRRPTGPWRFIRSAAAAHIDPADNGQLRIKRENEAKSLNFVLPEQLTAAGQLEVRLVTIFQTEPVAFLIPPAARRTVTFVATPPLKVRLLGIRYQYGRPAASAEPSALDYLLIESWLQRAFPAAEVQWSQAVVDGPASWPFVASTINAFVRGVRMSEVGGGSIDARTHYYGLVSDAGGANFMRGLASGIPGMPDPSTVASGPTGSGTWGWDTDGSFGDWYTGHELGHTFGRFHAEFCGAGGGAPYPFVNGQLSNADGAFVGFDTGDADHGLPMRALPGTVWHDVMSYCPSQWLSSFTYTGIRDRIVAEDALPAGAMPTRSARRGAGTRGRAMSATGSVHVVATVNLTRASGQIRHVTAYDTPPVATPGDVTGRGGRASSAQPTLSLRVYAGRSRAREFPAEFIRDACTDRSDDVTGAIDVLLPAVKGASRIDLLLNGEVVDRYEAGDQVRAVRNVRGAGRSRAATRVRDADRVESTDETGLLVWQPSGAARQARARAGGAVASRLRYTVQVSSDGGATWHTAAFGLAEPQARIDRQLLGDAETVKVRVVATNGFSRAVTEKTVPVSAL